MISHRLPTISAAHQWFMHNLIWNHNEIETEDGETTWEMLRPAYVEITCPKEDMIHPKSSFQLQKCEEYAKQLMGGTFNEFDYTYHDRLFRYETRLECDYRESVDQIGTLINHLKKNPQTRRALAITWSPKYDNYDSKYIGTVPCLQYIQFLYRNNRLNMICLFRSEDMLQAFGPNAYGLVRLMEHVSTEVGVPMGTYTHIVTVPHLYPVRDKADLQRWM